MPVIKLVPVGQLRTACYIVYEQDRDDCVVIDPGAQADVIRAAMDGRRVAAVLLTHGHFDHIAAAGALLGEGTELMIHEQDAKLLNDPDLNVSWMIGQDITCPPATRLLHEGDVIEAAGMTFTVMHTPGHTAGGVCYVCGDHIFTGDTLFDHGYGRTDLPTGDEHLLMQSLRRLIRLRDRYTIHGGHC